MEVNPADEIKRLNTERGNLIIEQYNKKKAGDQLGVKRIEKRLKEIKTEMTNWSKH
jgi:phosphopantothenate synthetase